MSSSPRAFGVAAFAAVATAACGTLLAIDPDPPGVSRADAATSGDGSLTAEGGDGGGDGGAPDDGSSIVISADAGPLLVFVSEGTTAGDMRFNAGGAPGRGRADAVCNAEATSAGRPGTYVAWLSNESGASDDNAIDRLPEGRVWMLRSGAVVFGSRSAIPGQPLAPIVQTAAGSIIDPDGGDLTTVYTGTGSDGRKLVGNTCTSWASAGGGGVQAQLGRTDVVSQWTVSIMTNCDATRRIYCFQQQ